MEIYKMENGSFSLSSVSDFGVIYKRAEISDDFSTLVYSTLSNSIGICKQNNGTFETVF